MMRKNFASVLLLALIALLPCMAGALPKSTNGGSENEGRPMVREEVFVFYSIDDFEDGDIAKDPAWWAFDGVSATCLNNSEFQKGNKIVIADIGDYSLNLKGKAESWYVGGVGTYLGIDASKYTYFQMDVYGRGKDSGKIRIELYDDDNRNWQIEHDIAKSYAQRYDDKFVYDLDVNWTGWQRISIPLFELADDNPGIGDDIWNPAQDGGSGGLIQLQVLLIAKGKTGLVNLNIDNVRLVQAGRVK